MDKYTMNWKGRFLEVTCDGKSDEAFKEVDCKVIDVTEREETIPEDIKKKVEKFLEWWMEE